MLNHDAPQLANVERLTGLKHRPPNSVSGLETSIDILPLSHSPKSVCSWAAGSTILEHIFEQLKRELHYSLADDSTSNDASNLHG